MEESLQNETTVGTQEKENLIGEPSVDEVQPANEQLAQQCTKSFLQDGKMKCTSANSAKVKRKSRLKCDVCSRGFEMRKVLARHRQTHFSGALGERYVEDRKLEAPESSTKQRSLTSVQRYLTLNMATAMRMREGGDDKRRKVVQSRISKALRLKLSSDGRNLEEIKKKKKLAHSSKRDNFLRIVPSQIQDRTQNTTSERMTVLPHFDEGAGPSQVTNIVPSQLQERTSNIAGQRIAMSEESSLDEGAGPSQLPRKVPSEIRDRTLDDSSKGIFVTAASSIDAVAGPSRLTRNVPTLIRTPDIASERIAGTATSSIDEGTGPSQPVLEMSSPWSILDSDSPQTSKFNLKADPGTREHASTADEGPQGSPPSSQPQGLGRSIKLERQEEPVDLLNPMSDVSAMRAGVIDLFTSLKCENQEDADIAPYHNDISDDSEFYDDDDDVDDEEEDNVDDNVDIRYDNGNKPKEMPILDRKGQLSTKVKRSRSKRSTYCEICQKHFQKLDRHLIVHYGERSFKCEICGKAFYEARTLDKHRTTHTKQHKCSVCGESFSKLRAARRHAKIHLPAKPYSCEICNQSFTCRSSVRKHIQSIHAAVRQYVCDICGVALRTLNSLKSHKRTHTGEKPFVCEICGKSFRYSSGLHVHSFAHTTGKPYPCSKCDQYFAHNYLRKRHLLTHETDDVAQTKDGGLGRVSTNPSSTSDALRFDEFPPRHPFNKETDPRQHFMQVPSASQDADDAALLSNEERALRMTTVLGPDSFKGGHRWTPAASLVVTLCDGSYKALKDLKKQGAEEDDLPSHYPDYL